MAVTAYLSIPNNHRKHIPEIEAYLRYVLSDLELSYWNGGLYSTKPLDSADVMFLVLNDIRFEQFIDTMSAGIAKEYGRALAQGKPIYLLYQLRQNEGWRIYKIDDDDGLLAGFPGTTAQAVDEIQELAGETSSHALETSSDKYIWLL